MRLQITVLHYIVTDVSTGNIPEVRDIFVLLWCISTNTDPIHE
jgi:hypothetical protein